MKRITVAELEEYKEKMIIETKAAQQIVADMQEQQQALESVKNEYKEAKTQIDSLLAKTSEAERVSAQITKSGSQQTQLTENVEELVGECQERKDGLDNLTLKAEELIQQVNNVLPSATSIGLASAFEARKKSFVKPARFWAVVFFAAIAGLLWVVHGDEDSMNVGDKVWGWSVLLNYYLSKAPYVAPLIWLALYASRRSTQALRLEEDYAHKAALSNAFEGYKKQIKDEADTENKPLINLIDKTLNALSQHPDRIYRAERERRSFLGTIVNSVSRKNED